MSQQETTTHPAELFEALYARYCSRTDPDHLSAIFAINDGEDEHGKPMKDFARAAVQNEKRLIETGNKYFEQGYRLHSTDRQIIGIGGFTIPDRAADWKVLPAGHIATTEAERLWYVTAED